mmetsp:Transcript_12555/g.18816  ORF Transcript_12555/g.18816 Transcript_12555/m.18816 type:complete len:261 (-) Transcript_12555:68-850(-)
MHHIKKQNKQGFTIYKMTCPQCHEKEPTMIHNEGVQAEVNDMKRRCHQCAKEVRLCDMTHHLKVQCKTPCRMQAFGCLFVGNPAKHRAHAKTCSFLKVESTLNAYREAAEAAQRQAQENYELMYRYMCQVQSLSQRQQTLTSSLTSKQQRIDDLKEKEGHLKHIITNSASVIQSLIQYGTFPSQFFSRLNLEKSLPSTSLTSTTSFPESPYSEDYLYDDDDEQLDHSDVVVVEEEDPLVDPPSYEEVISKMSPMDLPPFV